MICFQFHHLRILTLDKSKYVEGGSGFSSVEAEALLQKQLEAEANSTASKVWESRSKKS